jgi:hypothetical protein
MNQKLELQLKIDQCVDHQMAAERDFLNVPTTFYNFKATTPKMMSLILLTKGINS